MVELGVSGCWPVNAATTNPRCPLRVHFTSPVLAPPVCNTLECYMSSSPVSPDAAGKDSPANHSPNDCSPVLSTPKRPTHRALLATPSTRSRSYYSGFNSPAVIRWLCSPAVCPGTRVQHSRRRASPALGGQATRDPENGKDKQVFSMGCCVCVCVCVHVHACVLTSF